MRNVVGACEKRGVDTMRGLRLVAADRTDVQRISSWVTSQTDVLRFAGPSLTYPFTVEEFFESTAGRWESFILRAGSAAVATGALEDKPMGEVRIGRVLVDPDQRGHGVGRAIMQLLIDRASASPGAACTTLSVFEQNHAARASTNPSGSPTPVAALPSMLDVRRGPAWT
jgi:[ribosomal protein S18]-alanine N-acetyltransferase